MLLVGRAQLFRSVVGISLLVLMDSRAFLSAAPSEGGSLGRGGEDRQGPFQSTQWDLTFLDVLVQKKKEHAQLACLRCPRLKGFFSLASRWPKKVAGARPLLVGGRLGLFPWPGKAWQTQSQERRSDAKGRRSLFRWACLRRKPWWPSRGSPQAKPGWESSRGGDPTDGPLGREIPP